jgi:MYXO-CTERM domain-containing protein
MKFTSICAASLVGLATGLAHGHEGHGLPGASHWHAHDVGPTLLLAAVAVAALLWWRQRK